MAKWIHQVSLDWLKARQDCLTATDVKELVPFTKTGRPRKIGNESYLKVLASKLKYLTISDCHSDGSAARGHILEPYAIEKFNSAVPDEYKLKHMDDVIMVRDGHESGDLAFSPDAIGTYSSIDGEAPTLVAHDLKYIGEVKSYNPERHLIAGNTDKMDLEERWQIAAAMAVYDSIQFAFLIFYNPSLTDCMYVFKFDRSELENEIATILDVEEGWKDFQNKKSFAMRGRCAMAVILGNPADEQKIIDEIVKKEELDPVKSVLK